MRILLYPQQSRAVLRIYHYFGRFAGYGYILQTPNGGANHTDRLKTDTCLVNGDHALFKIIFRPLLSEPGLTVKMQALHLERHIIKKRHAQAYRHGQLNRNQSSFRTGGSSVSS